jgi:hypothetical protein
MDSQRYLFLIHRGGKMKWPKTTVLRLSVNVVDENEEHVRHESTIKVHQIARKLFQSFD